MNVKIKIQGIGRREEACRSLQNSYAYILLLQSSNFKEQELRKLVMLERWWQQLSSSRLIIYSRKQLEKLHK